MKKLFDLINKNVFLSRLGGLIKREEEKKQLPLITISREYASGGSIIASEVAKKLGKPWKAYHEEIVDRMAKESNLEKKLVEEADERKLSLVEEIIDDFFGKRYLNLSSYYKQLVKILSTIGNRGYGIIVGRGGNFLFPQSLKVRIIGDMDYRINISMKIHKISRARARRMLEASDRKRKEFSQALFQHDPRKAHHYDLIICISETLPIDEATNLIVTAVRRRFKLK